MPTLPPRHPQHHITQTHRADHRSPLDAEEGSAAWAVALKLLVPSIGSIQHMTGNTNIQLSSNWLQVGPPLETDWRNTYCHWCLLTFIPSYALNPTPSWRSCEGWSRYELWKSRWYLHFSSAMALVDGHLWMYWNSCLRQICPPKMLVVFHWCWEDSSILKLHIWSYLAFTCSPLLQIPNLDATYTDVSL